MDKSQVRSCISGSGSITYDPTTGVIGGGGGGTGTVTTVSVVTNDGVSGTVANATTTPAITLDLGTITPDAISILGSSGNGYLKLRSQSSTVPTPITGVTVWADNLNRFGWVNPSAYAVSLDDTGITASRNYTLPNASGTLALLSDITSGYVPYTGATGNVDLGANTLIAALLKANGSGGLGIQGSGGANSILVGAGGGQNVTIYGGAKLDYATASTLPVLDASKNLVSSAGSGYVKASSGVVSYNSIIPISDGGTGGALYAGWDLISTATASSSTTIDFTGLSSTYKTYKIIITDLIAATNTVNLLIRLGTGGTPTYDTGSNYGWAVGYLQGSPTTGAALGAVQGNLSDTSFRINSNSITNTSTKPVNGEITLYNPSQSSTFHALDSRINFFENSLICQNWATALYKSSTAVTAIRLFMSSGNIASGTIQLYGIR